MPTSYEIREAAANVATGIGCKTAARLLREWADAIDDPAPTVADDDPRVPDLERAVSSAELTIARLREELREARSVQIARIHVVEERMRSLADSLRAYTGSTPGGPAQ